MQDIVIKSPSLILSFDFEMQWGVHDSFGLGNHAYKKNIEQSKFIVLKMLKLLNERNISATWATVGALALDGWDDYFRIAPEPPKYNNSNFVINERHYESDPDGLLYFAPEIIRKIIASKGQELGSHSFSHLYFQEPGVTRGDFLADVDTVEKVFMDKFNLIPRSFVFPKNQVAFLDCLTETSILAYRGVENRWYHSSNSQIKNIFPARAMRLLDGVNPYTIQLNNREHGISRSSLFIRFNLPEFLWRMQLKKIHYAMASLRENQIFHCWWHPHNLGWDVKASMSRLKQLLDIFAELCEKKKIISINMVDSIL